MCLIYSVLFVVLRVSLSAYYSEDCLYSMQTFARIVFRESSE